MNYAANQPLLSVIIVNWNTRELIAACLASVAAEAAALAQSIIGPGIGPEADKAQVEMWAGVETIVVDNASTDGSVAMLRSTFPWVTLIENSTNIGFAGANNQAVPYCHGRYLLLLNSDTVVLPGAFKSLIELLECNPKVGAAGARYLNPDGSLQPSCYPEPTLARELWRMFHLDRLHAYGTYPMAEWPVTAPRPVDVVQGAALILRRELLDAMELFDTTYFMYSEEVDLCRRIRQAGWQIWWAPTAAIIHYGGQSTRQVALKMFLQLYQSKILYFRKHHGQAVTWFYKSVLMTATLVRLLLTPLAWLESRERRAEHLALANRYRHLALTLPHM